MKLIFGLAKRDWYQILRKSILFSYNITNNTLGEGQNWSKFKISGHFGQKNRISEWVGGVSERNFFFCPFLKNFCPFYSNHLTIPWNKWKKCKNHEPEPSELTNHYMLRTAYPIIPLTECWWNMKVLLKLFSWSEFMI